MVAHGNPEQIPDIGTTIFPTVGKVRKISCGSGTCGGEVCETEMMELGWLERQARNWLLRFLTFIIILAISLVPGLPVLPVICLLFFFSGCLILQEHHKIRGSEVCIYVITVLGKAQAGNQLSFSVGKVRKGRMVFARPNTRKTPLVNR